MAIEDKTKRLQRFRQGSPIEIIETLLNSIANFFNNEIDQAVSSNLWTLAILGIHAVALTITEGIFNKRGLEGFTFFLEKFMDEDKDGYRFSIIAKDIHTHRNIVAHQWLSSSGYEFGFDFQMQIGWEKRGETIFMNPNIYYQSFKKAFGAGGKIWDYDKLLTPEQAEAAKTRLLEKYEDR